MICATRKRLSGPRILEAREDNGLASPALVSCRGTRLWQFSVVCPAEIRLSLPQWSQRHTISKAPLCYVPWKGSSPLGAESNNGEQDHMHELPDFFQSVGGPHTEPTHNKLVGMALYVPAAVHCMEWASSLWVASSGADIDPICTNTKRAYILKSHYLHQTFGRCISFFWSGGIIFSV